MKTKILCAFSIFISLSTTELRAATNWGALLDQGSGKNINFGVAIGGVEPFARNETETYRPASTAKIVTAALALLHLGANYRFSTRVEWSAAGSAAGKLRIIGSGDPTFGMDEFHDNLRTRPDAFAEMLWERGIRSVAEVEVVSGNPGWDNITYPQGWLSNDYTSCYGALPQAFTININCARLSISSRNAARWLEEGVPVPVELRISAGKKNNIYVCNDLNLKSPIKKYEICGTWASGTTTLVLPVHDGNAWMHNLVHAALVRKGISVGRAAPAGKLTESSADFFSPPVREIIKPFLKNSIGVVGEALFRAVGALYGEDIYEQALVQEQRLLAHYGVSDITLWDGSGLSRENSMSPRSLLLLLEQLPRESFFMDLHKALAIAGVDGTLRNRMKGTAAQGVLRGKTGTLNGVYNLAGYVPWQGGYAPFVIFTRTTTAYAATARSAENRVGARLAAVSGNAAQDVPADYSELPYIPAHAGLDDQ